MSEPILVTYGTKHGSTREVADAVAETLEEHGQPPPRERRARLEGDSCLDNGHRGNIRLRESRIRSEGSPQHASADAPM